VTSFAHPEGEAHVKKQDLIPQPYGDGGVTHPYAAKSILSLSITDAPRPGHIEL
jgi:hypothetical protein